MMPDLDDFNDHFIYVSIASARLNTLKLLKRSLLKIDWKSFRHSVSRLLCRVLRPKRARLSQ